MNRREFIELFGLVLLSNSAGAFAGGGDRDGMTGGNRVLVIGAGLAGLAAARECKRQGHQVVILEARDRIGGRIWTSNTWPDLPLDLGATWIHGVKGNPITDLANKLEAKRLVTSYERTATYNTVGSLLSETEQARLDDIKKRVLYALRNAQMSEKDTSVRQAISSLKKALGDSPEAVRFLDFCLSGNIEHEYSGSARHLSAHWYDSAKVFRGDDALFADGFEVITDYLAKDSRVELSQVVKEIHWGKPEIEVITEKTAFIADRLIITLPLGVLQNNDVRFVPELPIEKRDAISKLGMGVLNKCYLRFSEAFWPDDVDWIQYVPSQHGKWTEWVSFQRVAQAPMLLGFNAADYGREIEGWSDGQIVASAMDTLKTIFGADIPQPVDYQITRWASDVFSRGSYSFNALGSKPEMRDVLASPVNTQLFFAGEATSKDYFATTHGAYLSGLRVARDVFLT